MSSWNLVNEALDWKGTGWEASKFLELGYEPDASGLTGSERVFDQVPVYVRKAFEYARQHSAAGLELRDYDNDGIENQWNNSASKTKAFYQLVRHLQAKGTPLTAVGLQGHFNMTNPVTWSKLTDSVKRYRALGLAVYVTELDAQQNDNAKTWNDTLAQTQGEYYYHYVKAALEGGVNGIFVWGTRDNQDSGWLKGENAVLFDESGNPKPAYYGVQRAFAEATLVSSGGNAGGGSAGAAGSGVGGLGAAAGGAGGSNATAGTAGKANGGGAGVASGGAATADQADSGCGCRMTPGPFNPLAGLLSLVVAAVATRRRTRGRRAIL